MDKKSISKLRKFLNKKLIQKSKVVLLGIVIASLFLPLTYNTKLAHSEELPCVLKSVTKYDNYGGSKDEKISRTAQNVTIDYNKVFDTSTALWDNEPLEIHFVILFKKETQAWKDEYCDGKVKVRLALTYDEWGGDYVAKSLLVEPEKITFDRGGGQNSEQGLKITGHFKIASVNSILNDEYKQKLQNEKVKNEFYFNLFVEEKPYTNHVIKSSPEFAIRLCEVREKCPEHTVKNIDINSTAGVGDSNIIPFPLLKFIFNTKVRDEDKRFLPEQLQSEKYHNFARTYVSNGSVVPFVLQGQIDLKEPADKKFSISKMGPATKVTMTKSDKTITEPKKVNGLIFGVVPTKKVLDVNNAATGLGCVKSTTETNYTIGTEQERYNFNFCKTSEPDGYNVGTDGIVMEPGKDGVYLGISITNSLLGKLGALNTVICKDDNGAASETSTKCENDTVTSFDAFHAIGVEKTLFQDTSIASIIATPAWTLAQAVYNSIDLAVAYNPAITFYVQIYPSEAAWKEHINDTIPASVPKYQGTVTSSTVEGTSLADQLFGLINKIVGYIVLLITKVIFWVFGTILLPVIVALIQVHPYKDEFVNFVYPGWIIIRNISNIFFIIALLYMGLKILFQMEDSGKTRSFIVNLILMALLVNFSLVIMQSVVAIADTVQAQFLPENSQVIESLAQKLMVDPIVTFRGGEDFSTEKQSGTSYASDIPKSIVLLVLAVAAFFSFVALIAFMFVRLVALWLLYMLSPLAYVGRILPETKGAATKYWSQLFTYAFNVPILAFFLNIAALMAVTFSAQTGDQVQVQGARGYLLGSAAAGIVEYALTVVSHFIVLVFIYFGMLYAQKFGGYGADKIVSFAKSGFDFVTKKAPKAVGMWAKDNVGEYLANTQKEKRPRLAAAISAATQPVLTGKKLAQRLWTDPKKAQMERMEEMRRPIDEYAKRAGMNKVQAMKMLGWKLAGKSAKRVQGRSDEYAQVMTDDERVQAAVKLGSENAELANLKNGITSGLTQITLEQAEIYQKELEKKIKEFLQKESDQLSGLEAKRAKAAARGDNQEEQRLQGEIDVIKANNDPERNRLRDRKDDIDSIIKAEAGNPPDTLVDPIDAKDALTLNAEHVQAKIADLDEKIDNDDLRRKKLGIENWNDYDRASVTKGMENIIRNRQFPEAEKQLVERLAAEAEQGKKYNDIDDPDVLQEVYKKALENNNVLLATAMAKKLFKMGYSKDLLSEHGFKNNIDGLKKFLGSMVKGAPVVVQNQIANELSNAAGEGGNRALHKAVSMNSEGQLGWNSKAEQFAKLSKTAGKKNVWEKKMNEMFYEDENGETQFLPGEADELKKISKNTEKHKQIRRAMPSSVAAEILKQEAAGKINLGALRSVIVDARGQI